MIHTQYITHLKSIFTFTLLILISIASINFIVDPSNIYSTPFQDNNERLVKQFTKKALYSQFGVKYKSTDINSRILTKGLATYSDNNDCAIIGSSHVKQISTFRNNKSLTNNCKSIINLGVDGGTMEDYMALSNILLESKNQVNKIIFGVDPWSLNFNRDKRWGILEGDFKKMNLRISNMDKSYSYSYSLQLFLNLINLDYLNASIKKIIEKENTTKKKEKSANPDNVFNVEKFDYTLGINGSGVLLPDGSTIYNSERIKGWKKSIKNVDGKHNYKIIEGAWYDEKAIEDFSSMITILKNKFTIIIVLTPYHPKVWSVKDQPTTIALRIIENKIHNISKQHKIKVIGSYNPDNIECLGSEFYDEMHPMDTCLMKLENKTTLY